MHKSRPSRISIPSFGFDRRSSRSLKSNSRPVSVYVAPPVQQIPQEVDEDAPAVPSVSDIDSLADVHEPLFEDSYIASGDNDRLPAPPSAALAAKWNEFLQGLSSPSSPATDDPADDSDLERSTSPISNASSGGDEEEVYNAACYEVEVATPTVLKSAGRPKVVDISPSGSIRSSRPRSSSCDSASSHYSDGSLASYSSPGTPLSSYYDSDHTGSALKDDSSQLAGAKKQELITKFPMPPAQPDVEWDESDAYSSADEMAFPMPAKAVRQTICRPASSEIARVWFKA